MLEFGLSLCLMAGTWAILRGGWVAQGGLQIIGFDAKALGLGVLALLAAWVLWGIMFGMALIVAVIIHEFGHVAAFRVCGHSDARFRLIPLLGGVAISSRAPASVDRSVFITLMGPAICLAPMALCYTTAQLIFQNASSLPAFQLAQFLSVLAMVLGALNFFNLLPLWPLDGGRITQNLVYSFIPAATHKASIAMTVLAAALCLITRSYFLLFFVMISWPNLLQSEQLLQAQRPMSKRSATLALFAYLAAMAAFFIGGQALLARFI